MENQDYQGRTVQGEKNDCVVRSFAKAMDLPYDVLHKICEKRGRKPGRGMNVSFDMMKGKRAVTIKGFLCVKHVRKTQMTIPKFLKKNPTGTFVCIIVGHAFTIIDGRLYGQPLDNSRIKYFISVRKVIKNEKTIDLNPGDIPGNVLY